MYTKGNRLGGDCNCTDCFRLRSGSYSHSKAIMVFAVLYVVGAVILFGGIFWAVGE